MVRSSSLAIFFSQTLLNLKCILLDITHRLIPNAFPTLPPQFTVKPAIPNPFVDQTGKVTTSYLTNWNSQSTLVAATEEVLLKLEGPLNGDDVSQSNLAQSSAMEAFLNSKNGEIQQIASKIEIDLRNKTIPELLFIYYNTEQYAYNYMSQQRRENENLLADIEEMTAKVESFQQDQFYYKSQIEGCQQQIEEKEQNIQNLIREKMSLERKFDKNEIVRKLRSEIDEKYSKPKHKLVNDFIEKRISYDDYIHQFKDLGMKHHYYTLLVDKLEKMK